MNRAFSRNSKLKIGQIVGWNRDRDANYKYNMFPEDAKFEIIKFYPLEEYYQIKCLKTGKNLGPFFADRFLHLITTKEILEELLKGNEEYQEQFYDLVRVP